MSALNHVAFSWRGDTLEIAVDGRDFADVLRDVEVSFQGGPAGGYAGLGAWAVGHRLREHFTGGPDSHLACGPDNKTVLLGCECGEPGCWPLMARIAVDHDTVTWSDFEQPHRRGLWSYEGFGPFVFARADYERALAAVAR